MKPFAAMINLQGKRVAIIGGGKVAERKVRSMLGTGANIVVISPRITDGLHVLVESHQITWNSKSYEVADIEDAFFVIAATNNDRVNEEVSQHCHPHQLMTVVSQPDVGNVTMPAVLEKGYLHVAVSTNGASPGVAKKIRDELDDMISNDVETALEIIAKRRKDIIETINDPMEKERLLNELVEKFTLNWKILSSHGS